MRISVIVNNRKDEARGYAELVCSLLREKNVEVHVLHHENYRKEELLGSDFVITLGGDGTMLRTVHVLSGAEIPVLGINVGHLGYLAEISGKEQIPEALEALVSGNFIRETRAMLYGEVVRQGQVIVRGQALNEVLLSRGKGIMILRFSVYVDGREASRYCADGIIISTPTGSTAYNLSAGGPIVSPAAPVYIMTPICSHSLNARAVVMEDNRVLEIHVESDQQLVAFDSENITELEVGDILRIHKAEQSAALVKIRKESFLETLREKMSEA